MLYILHGDDATSSRNRISQLLDGFKSTFLDGKSVRAFELEEKLSSSTLFDEKEAVVVENLFSKNPNKKEILALLKSQSFGMLLILWEGKKVPKSTLSLLKDAVVEEYSFPSFYFRFLDTLTPRNKKQSFALYHELLKTYASEQIFYSLIKRVRQLVILSSGSKNEELEKMAPWQLSNLKRQLQNWQEENLFSFYNSLKDAEIKLKTGGLPVSLSKHLDILILSKLT